MKLIAILLIIIACHGCEQECPISYDENEEIISIAARWELRQIKASTGVIEYAHRNGNIYSFTNDGAFKYVVGGVVVNSGTYAVTDNCNCGGDKKTLVITSTSFTGTRTINLSSADLIFYSNGDLPEVHFKRVDY